MVKLGSLWRSHDPIDTEAPFKVWQVAGGFVYLIREGTGHYRSTPVVSFRQMYAEVLP